MPIAGHSSVRRLRDVAIVMDLHEICPVGGWSSGRRDLRRRAMTPGSRGLPPLANVPDGERRNGGPQLVIRGKHPVVGMPVLAWWRHEIGKPVPSTQMA
jgi:hypothetical protein